METNSFEEKSLQLYKKSFLDKSYLSQKLDINTVEKLPIQSLLQKAIVKEAALPLEKFPPDEKFRNEVTLPSAGTTEEFLEELSTEHLTLDENMMLRENLVAQEQYTRGGQF